MRQGQPPPPHVGLRLTRAHEGSVVAPASNQRRSSDGLEIACWDGEVVRLAFAIAVSALDRMIRIA